MESALGRFLNIKHDVEAASRLLKYPELVDGIHIAAELQQILALKPDDLHAPNLINKIRNENIANLRSALSKVDWQNIDEHLEGKNQIDTEQLNSVFLTIFQLLVELKSTVNEVDFFKEPEGNKILLRG